MFSRMILRIPSSAYGKVTSTRSLSTHGVEAVDKLRLALEEYRIQNYAQCLPSRFKKDIVGAMAEKQSDLTLTLDGLQKVLANIRMDDRLTRSDMEVIFKEIGGNAEAISKENLMKIL